jgi:hypothetical protein
MALGVAGVAAVLLGLLSMALPKEGAAHGDDLIYEDIARDPFAAHTFPFGLRLGLPLVVHVLPFAHATGFIVVTVLCAGGAAGFAYLLMREVGAGTAISGTLAVLMAVSPPFLVVALRHGRNTDTASLFVMMAATYFAVQRRYWLLACTLVLGVAVREAALFVGPLAYALWATRPLDRAAAMRALLVTAPAIAAYLAIRVGIPTVGKAQVPGYGGPLIGERLKIVELGLQTPAAEFRRLLSVYGPLWVVAPFALAKLRLARRGLVLIALCCLAMTFALDWGRMMLLAAPVIYPASAYVLERHPRTQRPVFAAFVLLATVYAIYMARSGVRTGILEAGAPPYPVR